MQDKALGTLLRSQKCPVAPAPTLQEPLQTVIDLATTQTLANVLSRSCHFDRDQVEH